MEKYVISQYDNYELHYSKDQQLVYNRKFKRYLKLVKTQNGYLQVGLYKNGKEKIFGIHQLVWMCLKGDIPKGYEINHIDENKENNSIENLELLTRKENINHGTRTLRAAKANSIPIVAVRKDLSEILQYPSAIEAERDRGFDHRNISKCCQNKRKSAYGYYWFYQQDFEEYMNRFNNNLQDVIKYKLSLH